jgi:hypothetical protein
MITCIFGLTACGSETVLTEYEQQKVDDVCELATDKVVGMVMDYTDEAKRAELDNYTVEEIEHILKEEYDLTVNGFAMLTAIESFDSAIDEIGSVVSVGEATAEIDGKKIAQIQIISGCEDGNVTDFPNWEKNFAFAVKLQKQLSDSNSKLVRPLLLCSRKYNMHLMPCALQIEIGTDANTLLEAVYSAELFAESLSKLLKEYEN